MIFFDRYKLDSPSVASLFCRKLSLSLAFLFMSLVGYTQSTHSQTVFRSGPQFTEFPSFGENQSVQLGSPVQCPVPNFNISAFGGSGEDFARINTPLASSNRGVYNFGGVIGFNIPLGGSLSKFCKEFGQSRAAFENTRRENQLRNSQLSLIQQCFWLKTLGFLNDKNREVFKTNEKFSALLPCFDVSLDRSNATTANPVQDPPESNTDPAEEAGTVIQEQR